MDFSNEVERALALGKKHTQSVELSTAILSLPQEMQEKFAKEFSEGSTEYEKWVIKHVGKWYTHTGWLFWD
ncbi:MAG: hypothetical protein FWE16_05005 [Firmicutes bacterium]|nr:hypothetical protein [Bacillota bacterium]